MSICCWEQSHTICMRFRACDGDHYDRLVYLCTHCAAPVAQLLHACKGFDCDPSLFLFLAQYLQHSYRKRKGYEEARKKISWNLRCSHFPPKLFTFYLRLLLLALHSACGTATARARPTRRHARPSAGYRPSGEDVTRVAPLSVHGACTPRLLSR